MSKTSEVLAEHYGLTAEDHLGAVPAHYDDPMSPTWRREYSNSAATHVVVPIGDYENMVTALARAATFPQRAADWARNTLDPATITPLGRVAKLAEEVGEVAQAVVGDVESRTGRGEAVAEAAQAVLVLATLVGLHYPDRDLLDEALWELDRLVAKADRCEYECGADDPCPLSEPCPGKAEAGLVTIDDTGA